MATTTADVYSIPQEHLDFRDTIRQIARERIAPRAAEIDETGEYPWDVRQLLGENDILALPFGEEHGGTTRECPRDGDALLLTAREL